MYYYTLIFAHLLNSHTSEFFLQPHLLSFDSVDSADAITSFFHALITSSMKSFSRQFVTVETCFRFICKLSTSLPSSSAGASPTLSALNECILDAIWSIDAEIEDREYYLSQASGQTGTGSEAVELHHELRTDRTILADLLKQLLVCGHVNIYLLLISDTTSGVGHTYKVNVPRKARPWLVSGFEYLR